MNFGGCRLFNNSEVLEHYLIHKYGHFYDSLLSEIIIEKLFEQRDFYLNTIKHLEFQLIMEPTDNEIQQNKKLKISTIQELKKVEDEIRLNLSKKTI